MCLHLQLGAGGVYTQVFMYGLSCNVPHAVQATAAILVVNDATVVWHATQMAVGGLDIVASTLRSLGGL